MLSFRPFRGVPRASRATSLFVLCLLITLSSGAQGPASHAPIIGEVFSTDAAVQGSVMLAGGGIQVLSGSSVSAGHGTATLKLKRGGEVRVCAGTTVSLSASANGKELLLGFGGGTIETRYSLPLASDTVLTPDFRLMLAGPGAFHFAIGADRAGGTCVRALEASSASIIIYELMGTGAYQVKPGDDVYFPRGEVASAQSPAPTTCGCPPPQPVLQLAETAAPSQVAAPAADGNAGAVATATPSGTSAARQEVTPVVTFVESGRAPSPPTAGPPPALAATPQPIPLVAGPARRPALEPVTNLSPSRALPRPIVSSPPVLVASNQPPPDLTLPPQRVAFAPVTELSAARPAPPSGNPTPPAIASSQPVPSMLPPAPVAAEPVTILGSSRPQPATDVTPPAVASASASLPRMLPAQPAAPKLEPVTELPSIRPLASAEAGQPPSVAASDPLPAVALPPRPVAPEPVTQLASARAPEIPSAEPPPAVSSAGVLFPAPSDVTLPTPPTAPGEVKFQVDAPMVFRAEDFPAPPPTVTRADLRMPLPVIPPVVAPPPIPVNSSSPVAEAPPPAPKSQKKGFFSRLGGFFARMFGRGSG